LLSKSKKLAKSVEKIVMIITFEIIIIEVFDEQKKNKIKNTKIVKDIGTIFIPV
tara:strand:- start:394 stop:555 length:162 start_codon:yes stop_codon:yes gene_type:complete